MVADDSVVILKAESADGMTGTPES